MCFKEFCVSDKTKIEWSDSTWTPIRARVRKDAAEIAQAKGYTSLVQIAAKQAGRVGAQCERCSYGCDNCYSETFQSRCLPHNGTGLPFDRRSRDLVEYFLDEEMLLQPLKWRKPRKVFVCSQTDLFGEWVPDEWIDRILAVMALCSHLTFQVPTKRANRMERYFAPMRPNGSFAKGEIGLAYGRPARFFPRAFNRLPLNNETLLPWPLPNVWLGVSVENQEQADKRIPHLLRTPAEVRFLSVEPLLGPVRLKFMRNVCHRCNLPEKFTDNPRGSFKMGIPLMDSARESVWCPSCGFTYEEVSDIHWVIVGGESGPGARPCNVEHIRSIVRQCTAAEVKCFVKQVGSKAQSHSCRNEACTHPDCGMENWHLKDNKGGDPSEWPEDIRVREFPEAR